MAEVCLNISHLSLLLCFFNLLPIPPLDGSQVVRSLIGMSYETYHQIARYGILILILVLQIPLVQRLLDTDHHVPGWPLRAGSACPSAPDPGGQPQNPDFRRSQDRLWGRSSSAWSLNQTSYENTLARH